MISAPQSLQLRCENTEIAIAPQRGAIVTSFRVAGRELLYLDQATFDDASKNVRGGIPLLFPSPGKLENDCWSFGGRASELKQHGFARNLPWSVESSGPTRVVLALNASEVTLRSYPWPFRAHLVYRVAPGALHIEFSVTNDGDSLMPLAFGLHPYFVVADKTRARITTSATRAFDNLAKQTVPFTGFDLTRPELDIHLLDHGSSHASLALGDGTRITLDCSPQFQRWVIWTLAGKEFVCLEPWTAPGNALNTRDCLTVLAPGDTFEARVEIACS